MKKSHIPLLIGDILMFVAVALISYPNMVLLETMSPISVALCSLLILSGMCMVLAPFVFEHIENKQKISKDVKKTRENIDLIFENLSALQLMIAESKEAYDDIEEKLAFQLAKDTDLKFEAFENSLDETNDSLRAKLTEISKKLEETQNRITSTTAISEHNVLSIDEIREKLEVLTNSVDDFEKFLNTTETKFAPTNAEIEEITGIDDLSIDLDEDKSIAEETPAQETTDFSDVQEEKEENFEPSTLIEEEPIEKVDESKENIHEEDDDNDTLSESKGTQKQTDNNKLSGLMSKALNNAMSTASSVEKLIAASTTKEQETPNKPKEIIDEQPQQLSEEVVEEYEIIPEENDTFSQEDEQTFFVDETSTQSENNRLQENSEIESSTDDFDDLNFDDVEGSTEQSIEQNFYLQNNIADLKFDNTDSVTEAQTQSSKETLKEATHIPIDEMLFSSVAVEKKRTLTKKDTVITLNTLSIGIGNKPYMRGNLPPLNQDKGVVMDYVEIGVWRTILPAFEGEINYTIWKNDEEQIGENIYTITSGQKQEIKI